MWREARADRVFNAGNNIFLLVMAVVVLYPIIYVVSCSFSAPMEILSGKIWLLPRKPTLMGYEAVLKYRRLWSGFGNSLFYAAIGTCVNVFLTVVAAYPLSRKDFVGRNVIMFLFAFTMWFRGGIVPTYLIVQKIGILNTRLALILPGALGVWYVIITRTYFQAQIPEELFESAKVDGCDHFRFLVRINLPLSAPILAVIALFYAVGHWNAYFQAFLYLSNSKLYPLQLILREVLIMNRVDEMALMTDLAETENRVFLSEMLKYGMIVVSTLPVAIAYPFAQKYFVRGIMVGAIKG